MQQMMQFPMPTQTIPVQVPINNGNGQTIYQTVHVPIQTYGGNQLQMMQPQMQIIPQMTQQIANIITPSGQIQQVQLGPAMNQMAALQQQQQQQQQQTAQSTSQQTSGGGSSQSQGQVRFTILNLID